MEKRLEPLAPLLASLPKPLSLQFKEFATLILSRKIEIIHCEKRTQFTELNPDHYQSSIPDPKFELTCKAEFVDNNEFKTLRDKAKQAVLDMKNSLRSTISELQKLEETCTKSLLIDEFFDGLTDIFELYSSFTRTSSDKSIPYDDIEASGVLLMKFFYKYCADSDDEMYSFLFSKRTTILAALSTRKAKIPFLTSDNSSEDENTSDGFTEDAIKNIFPHIRTVTTELFTHYRQQLRIEEATVKTEALRQSKLKTSVSKDMAAILEKEPSLDPKNLQVLIDDRIAVKVNPSSILKKKHTTTPPNKKQRLSKKEKSKAAKAANKSSNKSDTTLKANPAKQAAVANKNKKSAKNPQGSQSNSLDSALHTSSDTTVPYHLPFVPPTPQEFIPSQAQLDHWLQQRSWLTTSRGREYRGRGRGRGRHGRDASRRGGRGRGRS